MSTARKKAIARRNIAYALFAFTALTVHLKLTGIIPLDTSGAPSLSAAYGLKMAYYTWPAIPFVIGFIFWGSSKEKFLQAEAEEQLASNEE